MFIGPWHPVLTKAQSLKGSHQLIGRWTLPLPVYFWFHLGRLLDLSVPSFWCCFPVLAGVLFLTLFVFATWEPFSILTIKITELLKLYAACIWSSSAVIVTLNSSIAEMLQIFILVFQYQTVGSCTDKEMLLRLWHLKVIFSLKAPNKYHPWEFILCVSPPCCECVSLGDASPVHRSIDVCFQTRSYLGSQAATR